MTSKERHLRRKTAKGQGASGSGFDESNPKIQEHHRERLATCCRCGSVNGALSQAAARW